MAAKEWSRYYRLLGGKIDVLHARSVIHRYPLHEDGCCYIIGLVGSGAFSYGLRGRRHVARTGQVFFIDANVPHSAAQ